MSSKEPKGSIYTLLYVGILGVVCALALTGARHVLGPYQTVNANTRKVRHVLLVLRVPGAETVSPDALTDLYASKIHEEGRGNTTVYEYVEEQKLRGVAVTFSGSGYLSPIRGFLSLEPDRKTIRALTITYHAETPGLGGQIGSRAFLDQFQGKQIDGLRLVRGRKAAADNKGRLSVRFSLKK